MQTRLFHDLFFQSFTGLRFRFRLGIRPKLTEVVFMKGNNGRIPSSYIRLLSDIPFRPKLSHHDLRKVCSCQERRAFNSIKCLSQCITRHLLQQKAIQSLFGI